jgi:hypothetical protein
VAIPAPFGSTYCIVSQSGSWFAYKLGPGGLIQTQASSAPAAVCT